MADLTFDMATTGHKQAVDAVGKVGRGYADAALKIEAANVRVEKATRALSRAQEKYGKDSLEARSAAVSLAQAQSKVETAMRQTEKATEDASGGLDDFKLAAAGVAAAAAAGLGLAVSKSLDIEAANDKLSAQLALTGPEAQRYGKIAGDLYAGAYGESLGQVNEALRAVTQQVGRLGDEGEDSLQNVTAKVLDLATAFDQDLYDITKATGLLMKTGLAKNAGEALDLITYGFQNIPGAAEDLLDTLSEYSVHFQQAGLNGQQALAFIGAAMQGGARNTDLAADALKEFVLRAGNVTDTGAQQALEDLGLSAEDMARAISGGGQGANQALADILGRLRAVEDPAKRSALATALLGTQAEDLQQALYAVDPSVFVAGLDGVAGSATSMGEALNDNTLSRIESYKRSVEQAIAGAAAAPGPIGAAAAAVTLFGGAALSAGADLALLFPVAKGLPGALKSVGNSFTDLIGRGNELVRTNGNVRASLVGVGAAVGVAAIAIPVASAGFGKIHDIFDKLPPEIDETAAGLEKFVATGRASGSAAAALGNDLTGVASTAGLLDGLSGKLIRLGDSAREVVLPLKAFSKPLEDQREALTAVDQALAQLASGGNADTAAAAFNRLAAEAERQGVSVEDLKRQLPEYSSALEAVESRSRSAGAASGELTRGVDGQGQSAAAAADAMKKLAEQTEEYTSNALEARGSARAFEEAIDEASASVRENGRTLDITTERGRANAAALDEVASSGMAMAQAILQNGGTQQQFQATLQRTRDELIKAGTRMGLTKDQARAYADQVLKIPAARNTRFTADTGTARGRVVELKKQIAGVNDKSVTLTVFYRASGDVQLRNELGGGRVRTGTAREHGGPVRKGQPYIVGEKRPELFVPDTDGRILPQVPRARPLAAAFGGGGGTGGAPVVINVYAPNYVGSHDELAEAMRKVVRDKGGGNVQKALGRS